jgi:hypothetical protein
MTDRRRPVRTWVSRAREVGSSRAAGLAAAAAITVLGILWLWRGVPTAGIPARIDNQVRIDSLVSELRSVALLSEPENNTTVIWVIDDGAGE